jgi:hypothetical protein
MIDTRRFLGTLDGVGISCNVIFARSVSIVLCTWDGVFIILQNEDFVAPADHHNTSGQFDPSVHSNEGVNSVSLFGFAQPIDSRVIQTTQQVAEFPYRLDYNSGEHIGIGMFSFSCNFR